MLLGLIRLHGIFGSLSDNLCCMGVFAGFCSYIYCFLGGSCHSSLNIGSYKMEEENYLRTNMDSDLKCYFDDRL